MEKEIWDQNIKDSADLLRNDESDIPGEMIAVLVELRNIIAGYNLSEQPADTTVSILTKISLYSIEEENGTLRGIVDNLWTGYNDISKNNDSTQDEKDAANGMKKQLEDFNNTY